MFGVLATLPTSSDIMAAIGNTSGPLFSDLLPFAEFIGGLILGVALIILIIGGLAKALHKPSA